MPRVVAAYEYSLDAELLSIMQVAILFEKVCRESEIGYNDHPTLPHTTASRPSVAKRRAGLRRGKSERAPARPRCTSTRACGGGEGEDGL